MVTKVTTLLSTLILSVLVTGCSEAVGPQESAEEYPSNDIRMVVSYSAGGPTDIAARAIAEYFQKEYGESIVVENVEGASGSVGTAEVAGSSSDGYTLGLTTVSALAQVPIAQDVGYDRNSFEYIGVASQVPYVLAVSQESQFETAEQFLEEAEENPGELSVAVGGAQTPQALELQRLHDEYNVEVDAVPFEGEAPVTTALLGGDVDALYESSGETVYSQIEAGEFRPLAVGTEQQASFLPNIPTLAELGYEDLTLGASTYGLVAPEGTPPEIIEKLEGTMREALQDPEVRDQINERYMLEDFSGTQEWERLAEETQEAYEPILDDS